MISIIIASVLGFVWGSIWYMSPIGKAWKSAKPVDPQDDHRKYMSSKRYMCEMFATSFLLTVASAYTLKAFILLSGVETLTAYIQVALLACFGFIVTTKFTDLMYTNTPPFWGKRAQIVFVVDSLYYIVLFTIFGLVDFYIR